MTGDVTSSYKAFERLSTLPIETLNPLFLVSNYDADEVFEMFELFDGPMGIVEQSIKGDVRATYKKLKPLMKWIFINVEGMNRAWREDEEYEWSTYG